MILRSKSTIWSFKIKIIIWRAPGRFAASPTQPYKCGRNVKVKIKIKTKINDKAVLTLILKY